MASVRLLPREHGTWAMLLAPWIVGVGVTGGLRANHVLLLVAALAFFLAQHHLTAWWRAVTGARADPVAAAVAGRLVLLSGGAGLLATLPLAIRIGVAPLLPYALAAVVLTGATLWLVARRLDHLLPGQLLAAVGLPLTAPAAWTVTHGRVDRVALALWLLDAAFFVGAVLYVRLKIEARTRRGRLGTLRARLAFAGGTLGADLLVLAVAALAVRVGGFSPLALLGFASVAVQAVVGVVRLDRPAVLKRVGLLATFHAVLFAVLVAWLA